MHLLINHYTEAILQQGDLSAVWERGLEQLSNGAVSGHFTLSNLPSFCDHPRALPETMRSDDKNKMLLLCYESLHEEYCVYWNNQNGPSSRI